MISIIFHCKLTFNIHINTMQKPRNHWILFTSPISLGAIYQPAEILTVIVLSYVYL